MSRYFFDLRTPDLLRDEEGSDLPNLASALEEAQACAADLVRDADVSGHDRHGWVLAIRDERRVPVCELPIHDWVAIGTLH